MAWTTPSLSSLYDQFKGALRRNLPDTDTHVEPNTNTVFGKTLALVNQHVYLRMAWIYKQIFAHTANVEHLAKHGYDIGVYRKPAARASGNVTLTAQASTAYPAGISFSAGNAFYDSTASATSDSGGNLTLILRSRDAGIAPNLPAGTSLTLVDQVLYPSLAVTAIVDTSGIGGGADREEDESYRARILDRKRRPPQGGAESDYEQWARNVPGVKKAWARRFQNGPGTVGVWILFEDRTNFIPSASDVAVVQADMDARRMVRLSTIVIAPVPENVDITITGLANDTATVRASVEAALAAMLLQRGRPGMSGDPFVLSRSWIGEAISGATGEDIHTLTLPAVDLSFADGNYPVLGTVTYA